MDFNPYEPPRTPIARDQDQKTLTLEEARSLRKAHRGGESSLRTIGLFWMIVGPTATAWLYFNAVDTNSIMWVFWAFQVPIVGIPLALGWGLRRLRNVARVTSCVFLGIPVLVVAAASQSEALAPYNFAIQTLVLVFLATCFVSLILPSAREACTPGYRSVVTLTPDVRIPLSLVAKIAIAEIIFAIPIFLLIKIGTNSRLD